MKTSFGMRRKTLRNSLRSLAENKGKSLSGEVFDLRPERLSVEDFVALTNYFED